ncbi:hypothetical protein F4775DRAFT_19744 [Biscogniauxia sp. FL1348]|nr:hypothetical protein F4775DRAFT_19744 [Biscogniauxia sp. FL1348]
MSTRILLLQRIRPGLVVGASLGLGLLVPARSLSRPLRMDARATPRQPAVARGERGDGVLLNADLMRQLSGGSIAGFLSGILVAVFSRTLVLFLGLSIVVVQVASRYGIDLVRQLRVKERLGHSRVLTALEKDPAFKLSFGLFFTMSAFMQF